MTVLPNARDIVKTTCPRDCYDACGIVAIRREGKVTKILGDPDHHVARGALCGKCAVAYNGVWRDENQRLTLPLARIGAKGESKFQAISWEEAIARISTRLRLLLDRHGGGVVAQTHYTGTCSAIAGNFPSRFFNRIGALEIDPDSVCNKAGHIALGLVFGSSLDGFDPRSAAAAGCILVWGANPSVSAPHAHKNWLFENDATRIVVDPVRHETASKAEIHLQLYPGSDAALAFGLLHVMQREALFDLAFIRNHTLGWDEIEADIAAMPPERAAVLTGVDTAKIERVARLYAAGPSLLWMGQGVQRQRQGGNIARAIALLPAGTGQIGAPGRGLLYMNGFGSRGVRLDYLSGAHLRPKNAPEPLSHMDLAEHLGSPAACKALFTWNNNIAASNPQQRKLAEVLQREDLFHVAIDLFHTDTTRFADIVLPAASFLEFDDLVLPYFHYDVSAQRQVMTPLGQVLPNQEIFRRLAMAMGFHEPELHESDAAILTQLMNDIGLGISFADLAVRGTQALCPDEPVVPFRDLRFPTPSGRIEIASERFVAAGTSRAPHAAVDPRPSEGRLRVLSPASAWLMNSSYGNDARVRELQGEQTVTVNPADMRRLRLEPADMVELENDTGLIGPLRLAVSDIVPPGVALLPKGRWLMHESNAGANVNILNGGEKSDLAAATAVHSVEATLRKATPPVAATP